MNSANNEKFGYSQLGAHSPHLDFSKKLVTRHLLLLAVINLNMVLRELLGPAYLFGAQTLCIHKTTEVVVVYKDENLMFVAF